MTSAICLAPVQVNYRDRIADSVLHVQPLERRIQSIQGWDSDRVPGISSKIVQKNGSYVPRASGALPQDVAKFLIVAVPVIVAAYWALCGQSSRKQRQGMSRSMLVALGSTLLLDFFCTDQYQPSMPDMARDFGVLPVHMGATIQVHLFTSAIFMLLFGPLSDYIGRRPAA